MLDQDTRVRRQPPVGRPNISFPADLESLIAAVDQAVVGLRNDERLRPLAHLIEVGHSDPDLHMDHYYGIIGMSPQGFRKRLLRLTGFGYTELLASYRLTRAARLFPDPARTISRAAEDAGFPDYRAFYLSCGRLLGMTPRALKNKLRKL